MQIVVANCCKLLLQIVAANCCCELLLQIFVANCCRVKILDWFGANNIRLGDMGYYVIKDSDRLHAVPPDLSLISVLQPGGVEGASNPLAAADDPPNSDSVQLLWRSRKRGRQSTNGSAASSGESPMSEGGEEEVGGIFSSALYFMTVL